MRCLTLAKALVEKGAMVQFICRNHEGNLIEEIRQEGFDVYTLANSFNGSKGQTEEFSQLAHAAWLGVSQNQDAKECQPILERNKPDWLIVDHYAIDMKWQKALKKHYKKLMVIDDLGDRTHLCDLLLDQNYGSKAIKYQNRVPAHCKILVGTHYAILRPEFSQWRDVSLKRRELQTFKTILITLGGIDSQNYTGQLLTELAKTQLNNKSICLVVVMGPTAPHRATIKQQAETMPIKTTVKTNVSNMAELMAFSDLAIGAGGSTTWERCCMGLPSIHFIIAENQRQIAQALEKDHVIKLINNVEQLTDLVGTAHRWIGEVSQQAAKVCDGLGCQRVVDQLLMIES